MTPSQNPAFSATDEGIVLTNAQINSSGGNISLQGTSSATSGAKAGILLEGSSILNSGGGNISLKGNSSGWNGVYVFGGSSSISSGNGSITIDGTTSSPGGKEGIRNNGSITSTTGSINLTGNSSGTSGIWNLGTISSTSGNIALNGTTARFQGIQNEGSISSTIGNINLTGSSSGTGKGIYIINGVVQTTGSGNINLTGTAAPGGEGISIENSSINPTGIGSGDVTLTADEINFAGNTQIKGKGILELQPLTTNLGITVGGTINDSNLNLNSSELAYIQNGFSQINIGRADSSGVITLGSDVTFIDPVTLRSPSDSGSIDTQGFNITGIDNASITLLANQNITTNNITTDQQGITLTSTSGDIKTGNLTTYGSGIAVAPDVSYYIIGRLFEITSPSFTSVSDGTFSGNVAEVAPGTTISLTGNYTLNPVDTSYCPWLLDPGLHSMDSTCSCRLTRVLFWWFSPKKWNFQLDNYCAYNSWKLQYWLGIYSCF